MGASSDMAGMGVAATATSLSLTSVIIFEIVWVVGMAAMMFPAMLPVTLFYNKIVAKTESNHRSAQIVGTPLFLSGYLAMYAGLGLAAYVAVFVGLSLASSAPVISTLPFLAPGLVLILAGTYQLTPWKARSLSHCVSPVDFFVLHSESGLPGAVRMGIRHGTYCVACCWAYMLVMLVVAAMSIPTMAILAGVIAIEKVLVRGARWYTRAVAGAFLLLGMVSFVPSILGFLAVGI
jgi:predicted metal-binding membrane protein